MTRINMAAIALAVSAPFTGLEAQLLRDARVAFRPAPAVTSQTQAPRDSTYPDTGTRTLSGAIGFLAGAYLGFKIADAAMGPCECDDPGLDAFIIGVPLGGLIGSTLGVGGARLHSPCPADERIAKAAAGSMLGFTAALALGVATQGPGVLLMPVLVPLGGSLAQGRC